MPLLDSPALLILASAPLVTALFSAVLLQGWTGWLALKRTEVGTTRPARTGDSLAELRDRVRRLEAIADGVEP